MAADTASDALDLTGVWNGLYSYPRAIEPVSFLTTLVETDSWLAGFIEEIASIGTMRGQTIAATVQGRRAGHAVTFLKTYDDLPQGYDTVHYAGDVNHNGSEIEGRWSIPGNWSGRFLMIRAGETEIALARDVAERVGG
jgi:hypothetical protein